MICSFILILHPFNTNYLYTMELTEINKSISLLKDDEKNLVSDWYHTFWELYEHRCVLYVSLCNVLYNLWWTVRKSKKHFDWTSRDWWFILQINTKTMIWQISYHLPMLYRDKVRVKSLPKAYKRDWHTSQDVLDRLLKL